MRFPIGVLGAVLFVAFIRRTNLRSEDKSPARLQEQRKQLGSLRLAQTPLRC